VLRVPERQKVKCGPVGMRACSLGLAWFKVRDKVKVSVRDRVGVRVSDGVRVSTFYFLSHYQPQKPAFYPYDTSHQKCRLQRRRMILMII